MDVAPDRMVDVVLEVRRGAIARTRGAQNLPTGNSSLFVAAADGDWRCVTSLTSMKGAELCVTLPTGSARWRIVWRAEGKSEPTADDRPLAEGKIDVEPGSEHVLEIP